MSASPEAGVEVSAREVSARLAAPIEQARGLPPEWYTDGGHFHREQRALASRTWCAVAFDHEIAPGDALPVRVGGEPIVLVRDGAGDLRGFLNVCSFDACPVVLEPMMGITSLTGPYHGWQWSLAGLLTHAPYIHGHASVTDEQLAALDGDLRPIALRRWHDLIFVCLAEEPPNFDDHLAPLLATLAGVDLGDMVPAHRADGTIAATESLVKANWKIVVENDVELLHEPFVHAFYASHPEISPKVDHDGNLTVRLMATDTLYGFAAPTAMYFDDELLSLAPVITVEGVTLPEFHIYDLYPNVALGVAANHVVLSIIRPLAADLTRIDTVYYLHRDLAHRPEVGTLVEELSAEWEIARVEDNVVVEATQRGRGSRLLGPTPYAPLWFPVLQAFHRRLARDLAEASDE